MNDATTNPLILTADNTMFYVDQGPTKQTGCTLTFELDGQRYRAFVRTNDGFSLIDAMPMDENGVCHRARRISAKDVYQRAVWL